MKISIFGLGYVGSVSAGCLAALGHEIIGVDPFAAKVEAINRGVPPVLETDLDELIGQAVARGQLRATTRADEAIAASEMSIVCVGTPSKPDGDLDLSFVLAVSREIGACLAVTERHHHVVIRSTVLPGTIRGAVIPALEAASGKRSGVDFSVSHHPEFLREGCAVADFHNPPKFVIGAEDARAGAIVASMYPRIDAPLVQTSIETSEMVKYADNIWHALKVTFANEIAGFAKEAGVDGREVMEIFCRDKKLNLGPAYLRPGYAFGGSCLPKDLRALTARAAQLGIVLPVIGSVMQSNARLMARGIGLIAALGQKPVSLLGLSFKAGTDDLRESPLVALALGLQKTGHDLKIFDRNIDLTKLVGANRHYLASHAPGLTERLVPSLEEALAHGAIIVVGNGDEEFLQIARRLSPQHQLVDLVGIADADLLGQRYHAINW